ncbi:Meiotic recombination protein SPO11-1 [Hibiscus syriacus]|uniref:DNA topoisomerase (ATP-hydrolyzing) n=1 Tax=Hibiscus syriacus TaxID=106335 RepID=A0A6A2WDQ6_HIBSY|nr:Meiotic recombination protein SPO11-1 [Hibiscus syriacus]
MWKCFFSLVSLGLKRRKLLKEHFEHVEAVFSYSVRPHYSFESSESLILIAYAEFTLSILEDLSEGRSPLIFIQRFRIYCTNSDSNWLVMGWLRFFEAGRKFDCINSPNTAHTIPVLVEDVKDLVSVAHYILVVEKESVFQRLANDKFCSKNRCIVITGRGYPDVPTRRFLRLLVHKFCLPVYCLVDCDPYGFDILATYRFGSMHMAYDAKFLRVPQIQWLGVFPSDSENFSLPQQCLLPLTIEDKRRTEAMLQRCYLDQEVLDWRSKLELMLQRGTKFEIEALSVHSLSFLAEVYIPWTRPSRRRCFQKTPPPHQRSSFSHAPLKTPEVPRQCPMSKPYGESPP